VDEETVAVKYVAEYAAKLDLAKVTFRPSVPGSTVSPHRLAWSRTLPFHGKNRGSNPRGDANLRKPATRKSCGLLSFWKRAN
jgi:hypothetical protein